MKRLNGEDDGAGKQLNKWKTWARAKMATMKDLTKAQPWVFLPPRGKTWDGMEHPTLEELSAENGEKLVRPALEKRFPEKEANDMMGESLGEVFGLAASCSRGWICKTMARTGTWNVRQSHISGFPCSCQRMDRASLRRHDRGTKSDSEGKGLWKLRFWWGIASHEILLSQLQG